MTAPSGDRSAPLLVWLAALGGLLGSVQADTIVWKGTVSTDWQEPNNWSPPTVPTAADTVAINDGTVQVSADAAFGTLDFNGGALRGALVVQPASTMNWFSGRLEANGSLTIATNGALNLTGSSSFRLVGCALTNWGTVTWHGGNWIIDYDGANYLGSVWNQPGGLIDIRCDQVISGLYTAGGQVHNAGTIRKSAGTGTTAFHPYLANSGRVEARQGNLNFQNGSDVGGTFQADSAAGIFFVAGVYSIAGDLDLAGPGQVQFLGGTYTLNLTSGTMELHGGSVVGPSVVGGTLRWYGGRMEAGGSLTIRTNGVLNLGTQLSFRALNCALTNWGTVIWQGGNWIVDYDGASYLGEVRNEPGGLIDIRCDQLLGGYFTPGGQVHNAGTIRKSGGSGTTVFLPYLANTGRFEAKAGSVNFQNGSDVGGTFQADGGAGLYFIAGAYFINGPLDLRGPGQVQFTGGTFTLNVTAGTMDLYGGIVVGPSVVGGTLRWYGGRMEAGGSLTIATNGVLNVIGPWSAHPLNCGLTNWGTVIWQAGNWTIDYDGASYLGEVWNQPGGLIDIRCDQWLQSSYTAGGQVHNAGTIRKSAGTGTTVVNVPLDNQGVLDVQTGGMALGGGNLAGGKLNCAISSASEFGSVAVAGGMTLDGTFSASLNRGYVPGSGDVFPLVRYGTLGDGFAAIDLPAVAAWQTRYSGGVFTVTVRNLRPVLVAPAAQTIDELTSFSLFLSASDPDSPPNVLAYSLVSAPEGMTIDPATGEIAWTPSEVQGPSTNTVVVRVADNGAPSLETTASFPIVVNEVNTAPVLDDLGDRAIDPLQLLTFTATAIDLDLPINALTFGLLGAPPGAQIDPASGLFSWRPTLADANTTNLIQVQVTDNGSPKLNDSKTFRAIVNAPRPVSLTAADYKTGRFTLKVSGPAGLDYVIMTSTNLMSWTDLVTKPSAATPFTYVDEETGPASKSYRVRASY
jgi:hypothetical protein